ncbi:MAG: hypothetical protein DRO23_11470 [Thermoprotei archaeon]|nr:MAG: hypothetical protein DRO23_11470 [Thermoprotei archaeon]
MVKKFNVKVKSERGTWFIPEVLGEDYEDAIRAVFSVLGLEEAEVEIKMVFDGEKPVDGRRIKMFYTIKWPKDILDFYRSLPSSRT